MQRAFRSTIGGLAFVVACSAPPSALDRGGSPAPASNSSPDTLAEPLQHPIGAFTVRARWDDPQLSWRCDPTGGPFSADAFERAARAAAQAWNETGVVWLVEAGPEEEADVVLSWHGPELREECQPFGGDAAAAHTGPLARPMFVHLDSSRPWDARPNQHAEWLTGAVLHEFGHVLGLGHSQDPDTLMFADTHAAEPQPADLAGLHALYGSGPPRVGDLRITSERDPSRDLVLEGVAPPGTAWRVFDTDGDSAAELLVWSLAPRGLGALILYRFAVGPSGPRLSETVGPFLGALPADGQHRFGVDDEGRRWVVSTFEDGTQRALRFTDAGQLTRAAFSEARAVLERPSALRPQDEALPDLDGDGLPETVRLR